jgi:hypothetical protein
MSRNKARQGRGGWLKDSKSGDGVKGEKLRINRQLLTGCDHGVSPAVKLAFLQNENDCVITNDANEITILNKGGCAKDIKVVAFISIAELIFERLLGEVSSQVRTRRNGGSGVAQVQTGVWTQGGLVMGRLRAMRKVAGNGNFNWGGTSWGGRGKSKISIHRGGRVKNRGGGSNMNNMTGGGREGEGHDGRGDAGHQLNLPVLTSRNSGAIYHPT